MATLVAIGYPDQGTAEQARDTVARLESELIIQADQVASISRDPEGKYHVHTSHGGGTTAGGAVWGASGGCSSAFSSSSRSPVGRWVPASAPYLAI